MGRSEKRTAQTLARRWRLAMAAAPPDRAGRIALLGRFGAMHPTSRVRCLSPRTAAIAATLSTGEGTCWACRLWRERVRHYVIPLERGGTRWRANQIDLCLACRDAVIPALRRSWARLSVRSTRRLVKWERQAVARRERQQQQRKELNDLAARARAAVDLTPRLVVRRMPTRRESR